MSRPLLLVAAIVCLGEGCRKAPAAAPVAPQPGDQALALRAQLAKRDFKGLEGELVRRQDAFEQTPAEEDASWSAFEAFAADDPATEKLLDDWVKTSGGAYPALGARAAYHERTGWRRRGTAWSAQTSEAQFEGMTSSFAKAREDCAAAIARNPRLAHCYTLLIRIGAPRSGIEPQPTRGEQPTPTSFMVRLAYLQSLAPRWGGSYEQMTAFARESAADASLNPRLKNLPAYIPADMGWVAQLSDDLPTAIRLYDEALAIAEEAAIYAGRAGAHYKREHYDLALADVKRALELGPNGWHYSNTNLVNALTYSGTIRHRAGDQSGAIRDVQRAMALDRRDEYAQETWTFINWR